MVSSTRTLMASAVDVAALPKDNTKDNTKDSNVAFRGKAASVNDEHKVEKEYKREIVWQNVAKFVWVHFLAVSGVYCAFVHASWATLGFSLLCYVWAGLSVTAGAHRLWTHRSYKASAALRFAFMLANNMAAENSILTWSRDHRAHHKYSETVADPHNANRGFFFAHMGWLMVRKHPEVISKGGKIDMSDLKADPIVAFQHKYYLPLMILGCFVFPTAIPMYFWNESFWTAYVVAVFRYCAGLHGTWLVNSAAHLWGDRPYDVHINPSENMFVSFFAIGEGFHNYHHTFPSDYSTSEWGWSFNITTAFIDIMAACGQVWGRRSMSDNVVKGRISRTGPSSKNKMVEAEPMDY